MPSRLLESCNDLADKVERHAGVLGLDWEGYSEVSRICEDFRRSCRELAENRGIDQLTIAFTGPKNSGKTTLLSLFVRDETTRRRLRAGYARADATEKVTWVGPNPPFDLREESETHFRCRESDLEDLGFPYTLVDVPGLNEADERRAEAAVHALDSALVKVLVLAQREMEDKAVFQYLSRADGSLVLPVVNLVRDKPSREDLDAFRERLAQHLPHAEVRPVVCLEDFGIRESGEESPVGTVGPDDAARLKESIRAAAGPRRLRELPQAQLNHKLQRFHEDVGRFMAKRLPASRRALDALRESERKLPRETLRHLLGSEPALRAGVRQRLRATFLQRTPCFFFPWRTVLALANLLHGAVERVPLVLMGSLPSFVSGAFTAAKNVRNARDFSREVEGGIRDYAESAVKEKITPEVRELEFVLRRELGTAKGEPPPRSDELEVTVSGLRNLQARSSEIFNQAVERRAPSRAAAVFCGFAGFLLFWGFFAWPVYGLYLDFFQAVGEVFGRTPEASGRFPAAPFGMLGTSLLLALLPMCFFMLAAVSLLVRPGKVSGCVDEIRSRHDETVAELAGAGLLTIKVEQPRIDACMFLLNLSVDRTRE